MSINRVVISGNLTRDPELRSTGGGTSVLRLGVAVNDRRKNQQTGEWEEFPNFVDVTVFGARAEALSRFLTKGTKVAIEGKLRWSQWETPQGDKRSKLEVIADEIELLTARDSGSREYSAPAAPSAGSPIDDLGEEIPF
jgi:single-strand DNA-binding protein